MGQAQEGGLEGARDLNAVGHLLALHVISATDQDREQVSVLAEAVQEVTGQSVKLAYAGIMGTPLKRQRRRPKLAASG
jgi:predicted regulator of amino acid metabolism with ACT domain